MGFFRIIDGFSILSFKDLDESGPGGSRQKILQNLDTMQLGHELGGITCPHVNAFDSLSLKAYAMYPIVSINNWMQDLTDRAETPE
ncbi:MAG: hypothetical protein M3270_01305, partial [Thermoproteota archaeon]|nr:hypothetical protein [Thermoproteota archaeon]